MVYDFGASASLSKRKNLISHSTYAGAARSNEHGKILWRVQNNKLLRNCFHRRRRIRGNWSNLTLTTMSGGLRSFFLCFDSHSAHNSQRQRINTRNFSIFWLAKLLSKCHNGAADNFSVRQFASSSNGAHKKNRPIRLAFKCSEEASAFCSRSRKLKKATTEKILNKILWKQFYYVLQSASSSLSQLTESINFVFFLSNRFLSTVWKSLNYELQLRCWRVLWLPHSQENRIIFMCHFHHRDKKYIFNWSDKVRSSNARASENLFPISNVCLSYLLLTLVLFIACDYIELKMVRRKSF